MSLSDYSILIIGCRASPLDLFLKAAWWIGQSQDSFTNFYAVFHATLWADKEDEDNDAQAKQLGW